MSFLSCLFFLLIISSWPISQRASSAYILLQFDGSFRPPQDPGFPTSSLARIGTAAACLVLVSGIDNDGGENNSINNNDKQEHVLYLGGRVLQSDCSVKNSAEAEYEGLLLGLEKAAHILSDAAATQQHTTAPPQPPLCEQIIVQGDCKTVIDQMTDSSRPRKLEEHFLRAQSWIEQIQTIGPAVVSFQHVPRDQNMLSDGLCGAIRTKFLEEPAYQKSHEMIRARQDETKTNSLPSTCSGILAHLTGPQSLIVHSKRPMLYHQLAEKAIHLKDYQCLISLGRLMEQEAKSIWSRADAPEESRRTLLAYGMDYQIKGLRGLSTKKSLKEAMSKERKNRISVETLNSQKGLMGVVEMLEEHHKRHNWEKKPCGANVTPQDVYYDKLWQEWLKSAQHTYQWQQEQCFWTRLEMETMPIAKIH